MSDVPVEMVPFLGVKIRAVAEPPLPLPVQPLVRQPHPAMLQESRELVLEHLPRRMVMLMV